MSDTPRNVSCETLTARLQRQLDAQDDRNLLVRDMDTAGYTKKEIATMTRLGRTTVYRILGAKYMYDHGLDRWTEPRPDAYQ